MFKIGKYCVGCHNCAMECSVGAINYIDTKYEINPEICTECGHCTEVCHISNIFDTDAIEEVIPHEDIYKQCDIVVAGAGTGLIAAVKAAQAGKKVIVLEKAKKIGGNTDFAHGFFPVYTKWHEENNFPDMREDAIKSYIERSNGIIEEDILKTAVLWMWRILRLAVPI